LEFALIAPILFLIMFGIIDFGLLIGGMLSAQHAVEDASRHGAVDPNPPADVISDIDAPGFLTLVSYEVCFIDEDGDLRNGEFGDSIRVEGHFEFPLSIPFLNFAGLFGGSFDPTIPINVDATKRLETGADTAGFEATPGGTCT
jgi:hypothetical protein